MKTSLSSLSSRAIALAGLFLAAAPFAHAEDEAKPYTVNGFADLYYQFDFGRPDTVPGSSPAFEINGRQYDTRHNRYRLSLAWIEVMRAVTAENPLGFNLTLLAGNSADIISAAEPGGADSYKNFGQAYVSYLLNGSTPITLDFGKFWTSIGYESTDSRTRDLYSISFNFFLNQPIYHTGLRASAPLSDKLTATAGIVQGWNEVQDSNSAKSFFLSGSLAATSKLGLTLTGYFGKEGSTGVNGIGFAQEADLSLVDFIASYQLDDTTKLVLNADYGNAKGLGKFSGIALYGKKTLSDKTSAALRFEHVEDPDGIRSGVASTQVHSLSGTYDWNVASNLTLRFEIREDFANSEIFNASNGLKKNRTTLTFAQVLKF